MRRPSIEESAAIAAAYAIIRGRAQREPRTEGSRWRLAAQFPDLDATRARIAARASSRWSAAARLDD